VENPYLKVKEGRGDPALVEKLPIKVRSERTIAPAKTRVARGRKHKGVKLLKAKGKIFELGFGKEIASAIFTSYQD
jgi:hypothetical protein